MKFKDISNKTKADLQKMLSEKREALRQFRFAGAGAKSKNVRESRTIKKEIAKLLTALGQPESK